MAALGFSNSLGIHDNALLVRAQRSEVLANNLANADTPGFKARDIDFNAILRGEVSKNQSLDVRRTQETTSRVGPRQIPRCFTGIHTSPLLMVIPSTPMSKTPNSPKTPCHTTPVLTF
jgi:hypothetical protein